MRPVERARVQTGLIVFSAAAVLFALLSGLPRLVSFGVTIGVVLILCAIWGVLQAMGAFLPRLDALKSGESEGEEAEKQPFWKRWAWALVILLGAALYLPALGSGGLWDPWETHYGEVARRMLERDDWISMWWQNEWFYSKPVLIMWIDCLGMALVGGNPYPDGQLFGAAWGMRFPVTVLAIACMWAVFHFVSRHFSTRAGIVAAVALGTMPTYAFLAHQTMTDMPYVATMSLALCLLACALETDDDQELRGRVVKLGPLGTIEINGHQALVALLIICVLPFNLYLLSRPMTFEEGSLGQENVRVLSQVVPIPLGLLGGLALIGLGWLLWTLRRERRARRIYLLVAYLFVGLAVLGKVLPGLALPGMVLCLYLVVTGRWRELRRLEISRGLLVLAVVILPWYLAVVFRHGGPFIDRIIFHDIVNRAVVGVHGDTGTMEYYAQQLGYGMFPWLALIPLGLFGFGWHRRELLKTPEGRSRIFVLIWAFSFFVFFSAVITKFHHYIFPTIIPLAILVGLAFDELLSGRFRRPEPLLVCGLALLAAVGWDLTRPSDMGKAGYQRFVDLFTYNYRRIWPEGEEYDYSKVLLILVAAVVVISISLLIPVAKRVMAWSVVVAAIVFSGWLLDVYMAEVGRHWAQANLIQEYYTLREGPDERLVAYQMNWKGENFYTGNRVIVYVSLDTDGFEQWVQEHAGERHFFITERTRFDGLRSALNRSRDGAGTRMEEIGAPPGPDRGELCNKFRMGVTTL